MVKNQLLSLTCEGLGAEMEGVCRHEGQAVFVAGALPGETLEAVAMKVEPRYAFAKMIVLHTESPDRQQPPCPYFAACGGCACQHMRYEATLRAKRRQVLDCLTRIGGFPLTEADVPPALGAASPLRCRNKTALPVGGTPDAPELGFYRRRSHRIVPIDDCLVSMEGVAEVIAAVREWMRGDRVMPYDELTHRGLLRHVIVRRTRAGEVMVLLVATGERLPGLPRLIRLLTEKAAGFCALHLSVNASRTNVILGKTSQRLHGRDVITERLLGLELEISPLSFFQVNPRQTEVLYQTAMDFACLESGDTVADAYAGAGAIALCMAGQARKVVGMELAPQAVESARRNAKRNGIENAVFHEGAVEALLPRLVAEGLRPDVLVLDPPRKGVEPAVIEAALRAAPRRVVYVSCHVPTQARDLCLLARGGYRLERCQPVDLFCYASGVENVVSMARD